ncbi:MAG: hypothetical protein M3N98_11025 [Actinomycetota bacterium]|nr:hypothetical protein [Actinomycetota bacterium]
MNRLIALALRNAWRKGIVKGSRPWLYAGGVAVLMRLLQRAWSREESVVYREPLQAGETIVISHERPA